MALLNESLIATSIVASRWVELSLLESFVELFELSLFESFVELSLPDELSEPSAELSSVVELSL
ncbi:hypothetical protein D9M68_982270 [compost metagenome]